MRITIQVHHPRLLSHGEPVRVERALAISFVDGKPVTSETGRFEIRASIQPLSGREMQIVPEGDRMKTLMWFYSASEIIVNDVLISEGVRYQVNHSEAWPGHWKARAARIDVGDNASP